MYGRANELEDDGEGPRIPALPLPEGEVEPAPPPPAGDRPDSEGAAELGELPRRSLSEGFRYPRPLR